MKHFTRSLWLIFLSLLLFAGSHSPAHAEVVCLNTIPVSNYDANHPQLKLQNNTLLWLTEPQTLNRYDLVTGITTPITTSFSSTYKGFDLDGDYLVFVDQAEHIQLYTISSGSVSQITGGNKQYSDPRIEGNNVVYRKKKQTTDGKVFYKLYVYDIAGATTTKVGPKYPKEYDYDLNQGRILWNGNTLYTIATHSNTSLGSYNFIDLDGHYAVTVFRDLGYIRKTLLLKDLTTGTVSTIAQYVNSAQDELIDIENVIVSGDYIVWVVDYYDPESSYQWIKLYQISSGKYIDTGIPDSGLAFASLSEPFLTGKLLDDSSNYWHLYVYDIPSTSLTPLVYGDYVASLTHVSANRNIAWVGAKYDPITDDTYDPQLFLRTDCGSTPKIIAQSHDLNILTGRSAELFVTTGADQPITYQWYQGAWGDTSTPVGINSPNFTTPPLTQPASYWVRLTNLYGVEDSALITITPDNTAELVLNGGFEEGLASVWQVKPQSFVYTVNDEEGEPPVVHSGEEALAVSADNGAFSKAKVKQQITSGQYQPGDQLTLSGWMLGQDITAASAIVQLKINYADGTKAKTVIKPVLSIFDYTLFTADPLTINGEVSNFQIQIKYSGKPGPWILDDLSVIHSPPENAGSPETIPLPASGLTGSK